MTSGTVVGSLLAKLGIDTAEFDAGLDQADRKSKAFVKATDQDMKGLAARVAASASAMRAALVGIAGPITVAVGGAVAAIQGVTSALSEMNAMAARAGVPVEAFQELAFAAADSRVSIDSLTDGLKELQLRADEFVQTGGGSAAEAFQRLGYTAQDLKNKLQDPADLFEEIIQKLGTLDKAAQIRISDEIFGGTGGEQFLQFLDKGTGHIAKMRQEARDTGNVISKELVESAAATDREFQKIAATLDNNVKNAVVNVVDAVKTLQSSVSSLGNADFFKRFNEWMGYNNPETAAKFGITYTAPSGGGIGSDANQPLVMPPTSLVPPSAPTGSGRGGGVSEAEQRQQALAQRLESLRQTLATEEELERESYAKRLADLQEGLNTQALTVEQYQELQRRAFEEHNDQLAEIARREAEREMRIREQLVGNFSDIMGSLASLAETFGEKGFAAAKAFGIAQAGINVAEGVTKALTLPFPLNWAQAAAVAAAGAAQIASIASARPGSAKRPSVSGSAASGSGSSSGGEAAAADPSRAIYLSIQGELVSRAAVEELFRQFVGMQKDGYRLIVGN